MDSERKRVRSRKARKERKEEMQSLQEKGDIPHIDSGEVIPASLSPQAKTGSSPIGNETKQKEHYARLDVEEDDSQDLWRYSIVTLSTMLFGIFSILFGVVLFMFGIGGKRGGTKAIMESHPRIVFIPAIYGITKVIKIIRRMRDIRNIYVDDQITKSIV